MDGFRQQRTWEWARRLGLSQLACLGRHTITGVLCTCGRQFVDWSADYRVFSKDAKLFHPPDDQDQPAVGAKRKYGAQAPTPDQLRRDDSIPWEQVTAFGAGKTHTFRVKTIAPLLWKKAGPQKPLGPVVIAPVGYRPGKGSKLLYRQPAHLICTDPDLPLDRLIQYYLWRWDIEVNHRDEKQIIGVGQAQVWSERSVDRQPALAVASYAILLLAATRALGVDVTGGALPPPKWQTHRTKQRLSTEELIRQLRSEVWAYAIDQLEANPTDLATTQFASRKSLKLDLPVTSALLYASAG
jgi:hypothetical protein